MKRGPQKICFIQNRRKGDKAIVSKLLTSMVVVEQSQRGTNESEISSLWSVKLYKDIGFRIPVEEMFVN